MKGVQVIGEYVLEPTNQDNLVAEKEYIPKEDTRLVIKRFCAIIENTQMCVQIIT